MNNKEIPEDTVGGKPSYEAQKLRETFIFCKQLLANPKIDDGEKKTMEFYLECLKEITPCADENKFRRPHKGIGGTGDTQVFKPYVVRDRKTKKPLLNTKGNLVVIKCVFTDLVRYLDTIKSCRAESLRMVDGVWPLHEEDKKYAEPDPYAHAYEEVHKRIGR